ncbi:hypothetical protein A3C26_04065 [Candidatus Daviesbacteria bacterium RIFCSPHIGHO2_02_FULL_39_12]|uniref:Uncharacterized protein n=1 Tax=Candidatus Daviesbacteria bacterium RIFCSPHIGHO2_02_FULL_39_12 TaxID=1797770 RepID=A0A1F5J9U2_9BACT|nr:MAG: hypothetical protein A3C26_04065 [Candidatus Daviesbacteria bacterium RIFCSPHIGHO2_02_FULL_39_12]
MSYNMIVATKDILDIILILGVAIVVICIVYITYYLIQALKSIMDLSDTLTDVTLDIKDKLQRNALTAIPALLVALMGKVLKKRR